MANLGVKLEAEDRTAAMADRGDGTSLGRRQRNKVAPNGLHLIAVTHPDYRFLGYSREQAVSLLDAALGAAELSAGARLDLAAQNLAGELHAVADAERRDAELENGRIAFGCACLIDAGRAAGK